jgi:Protein of unknown function (DUF3370)
MFPLFPNFYLAQVQKPPIVKNGAFALEYVQRQRQKTIEQPQEIRQLPGQLDRTPVFNSNSPEVIQQDGILLSTFPGTGKTSPGAHLNYPLSGRFDFFSHHIARGNGSSDWRPIYQGTIVHNPSSKTVTVNIIQAVSFVTNPDAPFIDLPAQVDNSLGKTFSGPGSRLSTEVLQNRHQSQFPYSITIPPRESRILFSLPIALGNARSTFMRLRSDGAVYIANLAMKAPPNNPIDKDDNNDRGSLFEDDDDKKNNLPYREPTLEEWLRILLRGNLVTPRDRTPTAPNVKVEDVIYGRVAGIAIGSQWNGTITDDDRSNKLTIPDEGEAFGYPLSTVYDGTLGTKQIQSAPMAVRYPDTAYESHGNYGVRYKLSIPLYNSDGDDRTVTLSIQTPLKNDEEKEELIFIDPPEDKIFYRGTVQVKYSDDRGLLRTRAFHIVQRRGQQGEPLITLQMIPRQRRLVEIEFIYPPDATPPQILTISTAEN